MLPVLALNGPTASGKSSLAIRVAQALGEGGQPAEIVNADSMLVYRGMDIGTAKPTLAERQGITHHLIDIMPVTQTASVADFQVLARRAIADCRERGVIPIVVGGSALYMRAILDHFDFPGTDPQVRAQWEARLDEIGAVALHSILAERAPATAASIQPGNGRRIVRALEVLELTGGHSPTLPAWTYEIDGVWQVGLDLERSLMDERIADRVDAMWEAGLIDEVRSLEACGLRQGRTASRALGYRQVLAHLDGVSTESEARAATVSGTRRFARKQWGWFRRDTRITWFQADHAGLAQEVAAGLLARVAER